VSRDEADPPAWPWGRAALTSGGRRHRRASGLVRRKWMTAETTWRGRRCCAAFAVVIAVGLGGSNMVRRLDAYDLSPAQVGCFALLGRGARRRGRAARAAPSVVSPAPARHRRGARGVRAVLRGPAGRAYRGHCGLDVRRGGLRGTRRAARPPAAVRRRVPARPRADRVAEPAPATRCHPGARCCGSPRARRT
jgi:hypothetical protein